MKTVGPLTRNIRLQTTAAVVLSAAAAIEIIVCVLSFSIGALFTVIGEAALALLFFEIARQLRRRRDRTGET